MAAHTWAADAQDARVSPKDTECSPLVRTGGDGTAESTPLSDSPSAVSAVTAQIASFSDGTSAAPSSINARTGVMPWCR